MNRKMFPLLVFIILFIAGAGCSTADDATSTPSPTAVPQATPSTPAETPSPPSPTVPATTMASPVPSPQALEWKADGIISEGEYRHSMIVGNGMMELFWSSETDVLTMAMSTQYDGWAAIGFRPGSVMQDADIILGGSADGTPYIYDMHSTGRFGPHPPDTIIGGTFDVIESQSIETDTGTVVEFARPLNTGDEYDALLTSGETIPIIWAVSDNDEPLLKHNKGKGRVDFTL